MAERIIELDITGLTAKGDGLGRHNGLAVFVPGALPGESVRAGLEQVKKNYARAMLLELMRQAKERVFPACPFYYSCGGCVLQHLTYEAQLIWKRRWLKDALQRIGGQTVEAMLTRAKQCFKEGNIKKAKEYVNKARDIDPESEEVIGALNELKKFEKDVKKSILSHPLVIITLIVVISFILSQIIGRAITGMWLL